MQEREKLQDSVCVEGVKYPQVNVRLVGEDGNAFFILARVCGAMKKAKLTTEQIQEYTDEAKSGDYDHLLQVTMQYVDCDNVDCDNEEEGD